MYFLRFLTALLKLYHIIYLIKVYNSVIFLYMHRVVQLSPCSILEHFYYAKKKLYPLATTPLASHSLSPRQPLIYFLSVNLLVLDISCTWNRTLSGPL